jgi:hypothetical protein
VCSARGLSLQQAGLALIAVGVLSFVDTRYTLIHVSSHVSACRAPSLLLVPLRGDSLFCFINNVHSLRDQYTDHGQPVYIQPASATPRTATARNRSSDTRLFIIPTFYMILLGLTFIMDGFLGLSGCYYSTW